MKVEFVRVLLEFSGQLSILFLLVLDRYLKSKILFERGLVEL